jgi:hypothetical protein
MNVSSRSDRGLLHRGRNPASGNPVRGNPVRGNPARVMAGNATFFFLLSFH